MRGIRKNGKTLETGLFFKITGCLELPYQPEKIQAAIRYLLTQGAILGKASFLQGTPAQEMTYERIWEGEPSFECEAVTREDLETHVLLRVEITLPNGWESRLLVDFLVDTISYEVSLVFSDSALIEDVTPEEAARNEEELKKFGEGFFEALQPRSRFIGLEIEHP
ncbi:hypothetical protein [Tumebacillus flagellatus]|uniref:Uncharacterized protein n=1 Tax=Tumebacillus flagellatus TaxID=1157490 RepID=A0A074MB37_9BACL|nr:hypothetical protein [Tumebacillus flagellatus]KEO83127.1 hypothetical protein EL26_11705 [Tumebacillus flagellatus]